jgi:class 3 adenylate cyclase
LGAIPWRKGLLGGPVNIQKGRKKYSAGEERIVFCLCIDIVGSTAAGLQMDSRQRNEFNKVVVEQIEPYLSEFELEDAVVKFTGDGWLVMRPGEETIPSLVALAKTLCARFQHDLRRKLTRHAAEIPAIRASLFSGRDLAVMMPGLGRQRRGSIDWVGDSARRATRFNSCCGENELLVDYTVYSAVHLDFSCETVLTTELPESRRPKHAEENIAIYRVGDLRAPLNLKISKDETYYTTYAKYLRAIGELKKVEALVGEIHAAVVKQFAVTAGTSTADPDPSRTSPQSLQQSRDSGATKVRAALMGALQVVPAGSVRARIERTLQEFGFELGVATFSSLISRSPDYATALGWYEEMIKKGVTPNEVTYSTLVNISPDYATALGWYEEMIKKGVTPNEVTYNTLVNISPDYATALGWYEEMTKKGVTPDEKTHSALAKKVPDFKTGVELTKKLHKLGRYLGQGYFSSLFSTDISELAAEDLLAIYHSLPNRHEKGLEPVITTYRRHRKYQDALQVCLFAPHLDAAKKLYRERPEDAESFFTRVLEKDQNSPNGLYGLGVCLFENGQHERAQPFLKRAKELAYAAPRFSHIDNMLAVIRKQTRK